MRTPEPSHQST